MQPETRFGRPIRAENILTNGDYNTCPGGFSRSKASGFRHRCRLIRGRSRSTPHEPRITEPLQSVKPAETQVQASGRGPRAEPRRIEWKHRQRIAEVFAYGDLNEYIDNVLGIAWLNDSVLHAHRNIGQTVASLCEWKMRIRYRDKMTAKLHIDVVEAQYRGLEDASVGTAGEKGPQS